RGCDPAASEADAARKEDWRGWGTWWPGGARGAGPAGGAGGGRGGRAGGGGGRRRGGARGRGRGGGARGGRGQRRTAALAPCEARHAAQLAHPGIVQVYDYGLASAEGVDALAGPAGGYGLAGPEGVPFLVMELVDGPSLADVAARGPLDPSWVLDVIAQVAAAL